jgi:DNA-binding NtrC family response regulator
MTRAVPQSASVLLVDDDPGILFTFKLILQDAGFEVTAVSRGDAAIRKLEHTTYDAVIADLNLEREGQGLEIARAAKTTDPPPAVVIYTGYPALEQLRAAMALRVDYLALKPVDVDEMKSALYRLMARRADCLTCA